MARYAEDLKPLLKIMAGNNVQKLHLDDEVYMPISNTCYLFQTKYVVQWKSDFYLHYFPYKSNYIRWKFRYLHVL